MRHPSPRRALVAAATLAATLLLLAGPGGAATAKPKGEWVGTWSAAPTAAGGGQSGAGFNNQTIRMIVHTSVGGDAIRIRLSNTFGTAPLTVGHATLARPDAATATLTDILPASVQELTFNGDAAVTVPKGGQVLSDPLTLPVAELSDLVVSIYLPVATGPATFHLTSRQATWFGAGDTAAEATGATLTLTRNSWFYLSGVDVLSRKASGSVVVLGDSITDGTASTLNGNARWTDRLAARTLAQHSSHSEWGVLNAGLAGNTVIHDGSEIGFPELGLNGLARLQRDVLSQTGVQTAVVVLGINDLQIHNETPDRILDGLRQLTTQIDEAGIDVVVCTITPFEGFSSWTAEKEANRQTVNAWLRAHEGDFAGLIDFDQLLRDPAAPTKLRSEWDSGDHIHPNDTGYQAMADFVPLWLLS
ncbi:SGNH/GDSL hydrolase family protein [Catellatospora sp. KI3]|uniref:SGNH/GDSL hydrolase family protein n=1 Tax=Catellatospora sp. KI3 TaxID=3041620 RepID=UPI002483111B|nr:SGNH/GDSL hydrolase family protein [Catellatospora sp. KI3]MDI1462033.1 SGNH/GDSL hydrolase family protein [Catellatospora sp. KI3]